MSDTPATDAALDEIQNQENLRRFTEGSNQAEFLTPKDLLDLYRLEQTKAATEARATKGIFRRVR